MACAQVIPFPVSVPSLVEAVLAGCVAETRRAYGRHLRDFLASGLPLTREAVQRFVVRKTESSGTVSGQQALSAIKKLVSEAGERQVLDPVSVQAILRIGGIRRRGIRSGNWLTLEQVQGLLGLAENARDAALLAILVGTGLRREECALLLWDHVQQREGRMVIVDLVGKKQRIRTVPVPTWAAARLEAYRHGRTVGSVFDLTASGIWWIVKRYAHRAGIPQLAPHDLRRTCARLCRAGGAPMEQIQFVLGHASVQTTERYLGGGLELKPGLAAVDCMGVSL